MSGAGGGKHLLLDDESTDDEAADIFDFSDLGCGLAGWEAIEAQVVFLGGPTGPPVLPELFTDSNFFVSTAEANGPEIGLENWSDFIWSKVSPAPLNHFQNPSVSKKINKEK